MATLPEQRPPLVAGLGGTEFLRWYWLKQELVDFARRLGVRATGGKETLTARIAAQLDGRAFTEPPSSRPVGQPQLAGSLVELTVIPQGQRCGQTVRAWLTEEIGPSFHFDASMREFFSATDGTQTLKDARDHWHRTRDEGTREIGRPFEYNRFTRTWHAEHPDEDRAALLRAWHEYREKPVDNRGRA